MDIRLSEKQKELVEKNHNLIYSFAKKMNIDLDEYYDLLAIGLCKSAFYYDDSKNVKFSTYAFSSMKGEICTYWRHISAKKQIPKEDIISFEKFMEDGFNIHEIIPDDFNIEEYVISKCSSNEIYNNLKDSDKEIVDMLLNGKKCSDIAENKNVSRQAINLRIQRIRKEILKYKK